MAPDLSRLIRGVTFALLLLAATATEVAAVEGRSVWTALALASGWVGLAAVLSRLVPAAKDRHRVPPLLVLLPLLGLVALPFVVEPLRRDWQGVGYPLELRMVFALRNLGVGLAALGSWVLCLRLACVVSLFLMLFALTLSDRPAVLVLLGLYSAAGSVWLMLVHWEGLRRSFVASETPSLEVQTERAHLPWIPAGVVVALVGCVLAVLAVGPGRMARALGEWLPTSGGTGDHDPFARGGVNDGDDEVKGENPRSTGMTETDSFLDSPLPSLYDMINDRYGEPFKPRDRDPAIALDPRTKVAESKKPPANNLRPNREFATARQSPRQPRDPVDRAARALFEVEGRTPLHVRVAAFDTFDGLAWQEAPVNLQVCSLEKEAGSCWMKTELRQPTRVFGPAETHRFKITIPTGALVPTPPHLTRFRLGRVNRTDFFAWAPDRILRMAGRDTPAGVVVETECRTVDPGLLEGIRLPVVQAARLQEQSAGLNPEVTALARRWAGGRRKGWSQVAAIVQHLRAEYTLDPTYRVPEDCRDPLGHFLLQSRRGPDYQFASAAAVLPRVLGYPTRLVSGFYAAPEHYDPVTRHTPVGPDDLHFWAEVQLLCGDWLVVEPTPGYAVLGPSLPWTERLWAAAVAVAFWAWDHALGLGLGLVALGAIGWWRRELLDALAIGFCRCFPGRTWQGCVRRALWLLERRGRWAGRPRQTAQTVQTWLRSSLPGPGVADSLEELVRMAEWAAYAPGLAAPWQEGEVRRVCRRVLDGWTLRRWRRVVSAGTLSGV